MFRLRTLGFLLVGLAVGCSGQVSNPIGGNIEGIADWSWTRPFADLMKQGRKFGSASAPWDGAAAVDANGWPTGDCGVVLGVWSGQKSVGGIYKFRFHCATTPTITLAASPGVVQNVSRSSTGLVTGQITYPEGGSQLMLSFTNTKGGIRDLQVMRPNCLFTDVFTKAFQEHAKLFTALRFMDWGSTNGSAASKWNARPRVSDPSYAIQGTPWEVDLDLCNLTGRDAWINIPHMADDTYVAQLAALVKARLRSDLKVYVEYSNEVWNWGFEQSQWNLAQAKAAGANSELNFDKANNDGVWAARRIAQRIVRISDLFRGVYGDAAFDARVRPVLATQYAWPDLWLVEGLRFIVAKRPYPPSHYLSAIAVAPYFNLGADQTKEGLTVDKILADQSASVTALATDINLERCASLARYHGLKLVAYEGGPDTFGAGSIAQKHAAEMDVRMKPIVAKYFATWYGSGGDLFNWFVIGATSYDSQYGTWGLSDDMANLATAPKFLACQTARGTSFPLTAGILIPAQIDPRQHTDRSSDWKTQGPLSLSTTDWQGPSRDYYLRSIKAFTGQVALVAQDSGVAGKVEVLLDGASKGVLDVKLGSTAVTTASLPIAFSAGLHTLRLQTKVAGSTVTLTTLSIK